MSLPQELVDEIFSYLPLDDEQNEQSLLSSSLVAKSWINPSRRRLFKTVEIRDTTLQLWLDNIPPTNDSILQHIRSLSFIINTKANLPAFHQEYQIDVLQNHFPSLHQLRHLSFFSMHLPPDISQEIERFSAFRHTLTQLSPDRCVVTGSAFTTVINYFPGLNRLDLGRPFYQEDGKPAPPLSHPVIGKLCITELSEGGVCFFNRFLELGLVFDEIVFTERPVVHPGTVEHIINTVGASVKCLKLSKPFQRCTYITLQYTTST